MGRRKYRSAWHYWLGELGVCWIGGEWKPLKGFCRWWRRRRAARARLRSMWRNNQLTTAQKMDGMFKLRYASLSKDKTYADCLKEWLAKHGAVQEEVAGAAS